MWVSDVNQAPTIDAIYYTTIGSNGKPCTPVGQTPIKLIESGTIVAPLVRVEHDSKGNPVHYPYFAADGQTRVVWVVEDPSYEYGIGEYSTTRPIWRSNGNLLQPEAHDIHSYDFIIDHFNLKTLVTSELDAITGKYKIMLYNWDGDTLYPAFNNIRASFQVSDPSQEPMKDCYYPKIVSVWSEKNAEQFSYVTWLQDSNIVPNAFEVHVAAVDIDGVLSRYGRFRDNIVYPEYDIDADDDNDDKNLNFVRWEDTDRLKIVYITSGVCGYRQEGENWVQVQGDLATVVEFFYDVGLDQWVDPQRYFDIVPPASNPEEPFFDNPRYPKIAVDRRGWSHVVLVDMVYDNEYGFEFGDIWYIHHMFVTNGECQREMISEGTTNGEHACYPDLVLEKDLYPRDKWGLRMNDDDDREDNVVHIVWRVQYYHPSYAPGADLDYNLNYAKVRHYCGYDYRDGVDQHDVKKYQLSITHKDDLIEREDFIGLYNPTERLNDYMSPPRIVIDYNNNIHIVVASDVLDLYNMIDANPNNDYLNRVHYIKMNHAGDPLVCEEFVSTVKSDTPIPAIEMVYPSQVDYHLLPDNAVIAWLDTTRGFGNAKDDIAISRHLQYEMDQNTCPDVDPMLDFQ